MRHRPCAGAAWSTRPARQRSAPARSTNPRGPGRCGAAPVRTPPCRTLPRHRSCTRPSGRCGMPSAMPCATRAARARPRAGADRRLVADGRTEPAFGGRRSGHARARRPHRCGRTPPLRVRRTRPHARGRGATRPPRLPRDFLDQVPVGQVLGQAWRPGVLPWAVHALRGPEPPMFRSASRGPSPCRGPWTCPAPPSPCTPLVTPEGTAYHLPGRGVLVSGDALVTAHPTSRVSGPRLLPDMFHTDRARALQSLAVSERIDADTVLPGHAPVTTGSAGQTAPDRPRTPGDVTSGTGGAGASRPTGAHRVRRHTPRAVCSRGTSCGWRSRPASRVKSRHLPRASGASRLS